MRFLGVFMMILLMALPARAEKNLLAVDLMQDHVDITTGFNGAYLSLFGVQKEPGDIVITVTGPLRTTIVRQKDRALGIWMNRRSVKFRNVPFYYNYALANTEKNPADINVLKEYMLGLDGLALMPEAPIEDEILLTSFRQGLIRNKQALKLFPLKPEEIHFIDPNFFRTQFYIPSNVPPGDYTIKTFLLQNGYVKDVKQTNLRVAHVGASAAIFSFAHDWAFAYGLLCVLFAMGVGWLSNLIQRRLRVH